MGLSFRRRFFFFMLMAVSAVTVGSARASDAETTQASLNDGYSTFYHFCDQESQLSLLLWFKTAPPDIADYAKRISSTAKDDMAILKKFSATDSALHLDKTSLPSFELDVRKSMDKDRQQQLIWGSSGAGFAQAVAMTQSEGTNYGLHVAKVLAAMEPDPDRARAMREIAAKWAALHDEAYKLDR
jgi:hypothetical protein